MAPPLRFSIITPSCRQLNWLKLCAASVADQQGVEVEHIIQDAESGPELTAWVRAHTQAKLFVEQDSGMYDALNRGFQKATGDIVAWLNCDEQYLPGALAQVAAFFEAHPEAEMVFGDAVLIDEQGALLSYRCSVLPFWLHLHLSHLDTPTCAMFFRRSVIERGLLPQTEWKAIADVVWMADLLEAKVPMAMFHRPLAAFTLTQENLSQSSLAFEEGHRWRRESTRAWMRMLQIPVVTLHRLRKLLGGAYIARNISTRLYTRASTEVRVPVSARKLSFTWPDQPGH